MIRMDSLWWRERPLLRAFAQALEGDGETFPLDDLSIWAHKPRSAQVIRAIDTNGARYEIWKDAIWDLDSTGTKAQRWPLDELLLCLPGHPLTFISGGREMQLGVVAACDAPTQPGESPYS